MIQPKQNLTEEEMKRRVIARTGYADEKGLNFMVSAVQKIHAYLKEEDIQDGVCGYRELENWVLLFGQLKISGGQPRLRSLVRQQWIRKSRNI